MERTPPSNSRLVVHTMQHSNVVSLETEADGGGYLSTLAPGGLWRRLTTEFHLNFQLLTSFQLY